MGRRGPQRTPTEVLDKRGSWLARERKRATAGPVVQPRVAEVKPIPIMDPVKAIGLLPGYDPYRDAEGYAFDPKRARKAVRFFHKQLTHVKGAKARTPFYLEPWQQGLIGNLFGWVDAEGFRRYREAFIFVPRKNGKSPLAAGIILYLLTQDGEPGAEVYGAAREYQQATLVWYHARGMVEQNSDLAAKCQVFKGQSKSIELKSDHSIYRVVCSDALSAHGWNTHGGVVDELHALKDGELVDALETSIGARRQPLLIYITTSDFEREGSPCNEKHDYATKVRDGVIVNPRHLPVIYEADKEADWTDPEVWAAVNPNLGVSVTREYITAACEKAQRVPRLENRFKRLHLNIRTEQDVRWLAIAEWDACENTDLCLADLEGEPCFGALDMSSTRDLTCFGLLFPTHNYAWFPFFFCPKDNAHEREKTDKVPYITWAKQGFITLTDGNVVDHDRVKAKIFELAEHFKILEIPVDRWQAESLMQLLAGEGLEIVAFGQGFASMSAPTKELEKRILGRQVSHDGNPVMRWNVQNISVDDDAAENMKPSKKKSTGRIDGVVALIMALGRAMVIEAKGESVYEERGVLWI